jgi:hypothetical protein
MDRRVQNDTLTGVPTMMNLSYSVSGSLCFGHGKHFVREG